MTSKTRVIIPNLGVGNIKSVANMIAKCGGHVVLADQPIEMREDDKLVLAGVGAFDAAVRVLHQSGWHDALNKLVLDEQRKILGICLGMQLLCRGSEEGKLPGLGWIEADVKKFNFPLGSGLKVPHMGWNSVRVARQNLLIPINEVEEQRYYFVHSYYVACDEVDDVIATTLHGHEFVASVNHGNIYGVQFHPEKSHRFGLALLRNFLEI